MKKNLNIAVFTTNKVLAGASIVHAFHDNDGDWQFFSSEEELTEENAKVISLEEAIQIESSLKNVIENLPLGYEAYRETDTSEWFMRYDDGVIKNLN